MAIVIAASAAIGSLGQHTASTFSDVRFETDDAVVSSELMANKEETSSLAVAQRHLSRAQWANALSWVAVMMAAVWLVVHKKSPRRTASPRPLAKELGDVTCLEDVIKRQRIAKRLTNDREILLKGDLEIRHLMTGLPITFTSETTVQRASQIMDERSLDYVLVCDEDGELLGLVSHYYLKRTSAKTVEDAMSSDPPFVGPDAKLSPTVTQMMRIGASCVAVVEHNRAIGIVTTLDIQLALQAALQVLARLTSESRFDDPMVTT